MISAVFVADWPAKGSVEPVICPKFRRFAFRVRDGAPGEDFIDGYWTSRPACSHLAIMTDVTADVLIVGGGLVGGPLACALAGNGVSAVVVDGERPETALAPQFDGRTSAVALASQRMLNLIGLWPDISEYAAPIKQIRVSDGASPLFLHYDHRELGTQPLGWIVENRALRQAGQLGMARSDLITWLAPCHITALERGANGVTGRLDDGRTVRAALVVAADGRGSKVRQDAGITLTRWDYGQTALVCTVAHSKPHFDTAQEHFLPSGPFAILPLTGNRSSVVWTEKSHLAGPILAQSDADFHRELRSRFGDYLGDLTLEGPRFSYRLSLQMAKSYTAKRLALIGDAAHGMHPVAGQGMNMGLRDVAALAQALVEAKRLGMDLGDGQCLARYERWRRFDNLLMLGLTDTLVRLFSNDRAPLKIARDLGMAAVNRTPPLKHFFMRHAMGLTGEMPRLLKGEAL
jgi:2-octaprenyl-6-methoxyphenol hydroxylase